MFLYFSPVNLSSFGLCSQLLVDSPYSCWLPSNLNTSSRMYSEVAPVVRTLFRCSKVSPWQPRRINMLASSTLKKYESFRNSWPATLPPWSEWGYFTKGGPSTWSHFFPDAAGRRQSPINIKSNVVELSQGLESQPLRLCTKITSEMVMINAGHGWRVDLIGDPNTDTIDKEQCLSGGPLNGVFRLVQFHCHWGRHGESGSEHRIDGQSYAAELHFVFWNLEAGSCSEALTHPNGLAVLALFLELGEEANSEIQKLSEAVKNITYRDQFCEFNVGFDLSRLYPADLSYWTYEGSLTTPPCFENVRWIVFKDPVTVSEEQLESFRTMLCFAIDEDPPAENRFKGQVQFNFRPVQEVNDRSVQFCLSHCSP